MAATGRTSLGLVIGTNVQAWDGDLDAIAALAGTSGLLKKTAANTWSLDTSTYLTTASAASTYQPVSGDLTSIAGLGSTNGILRKTGTNSWALDGSNYNYFSISSISNSTSITFTPAAYGTGSTDTFLQTNTQAAGTLTINAPSVTSPQEGQKIMFRLQSTNVQTFSWNAAFAGSTDLPLPTASSGGGKYDYMGFIYNSSAGKWQLIAKNFGF